MIQKEFVFSVAVITYNQDSFIRNTLDSILLQKHNFSYEIVIGDDCSSDSTRKILLEYKNKFPAIIKIIFNNENLGIIKNFYNVISHCKGTYIMECAGDDFWLPNKVEKQIRFMEKHPTIDFVYGKAKSLNLDTDKFNIKAIGRKCCTFSDIVIANNIPALTVCYKKKLLDQYIYEINPLSKKWLMEDLPMWLWFSKNGKIGYIDSFFGVYRIRSNSVSHPKDVNKEQEFIASTIEIKQYFSTKYNDMFGVKILEFQKLFHNAWLKRDYKNIHSYGKLIPFKYKSFKDNIKVILSIFHILFNI